jgi:DNA processing protein
MGMTHDLDERRAHAAWARVPGAGPKAMAALRDAFGGLAPAWRADAGAIARTPGLRGSRGAALAAGRSEVDLAAAATTDRRSGARLVTWDDPDYPAGLHDLADPPPVLWALGAWPPPGRAVAIVGARAATPYGTGLARRLAADLVAADVAVVSGAAEGIDRAAHEGALDAPGGWTVGVLGCGFGHVYPAHHRALYKAISTRGTLLSEFPPEAPPSKGSFPRRNRLIAALARGVVVVEARARSGSLITVDHALDLGREVFAVPGPAGAPGSEGPHALLRDGATLVEGAPDVLRALGWEASAAAVGPVLGPAEAAIYAATGTLPVPLERLLAETGLDTAKAGAALVSLQLAGLVRPAPGGRWLRA